MATYGGATTVFALLFGRISKYTGRYVLFALAGLMNLGTLVVLYVWIPTSEDVVLVFMIPVMWGVSEGIWQIESNGETSIIKPTQ